MDYEKAYKEALETARKINNGDGVEAPADWTVCETIFPVLREDYDDMIRGAIIDHLKDNNLTEWADWLEKQGEQKLAYNEPKFKIGDVVRLKYGDGLEWLVKEKHEDGNYTIACADRDEFVLLDDKWELVKQNLNDKNEPKFHEGEWIIHLGTENIYQVVAHIYNQDNQYQLKYGDSYTVQDCADVDRCVRLYDVAKDAKDGDVLADKYNNIGFFKECEGIYWDSYIDLGCDGKLRGFSIGGKHEQTDAHPATKEQRDALMKAMTDAGWEFDFNKKELKKIEGESVWSEEDERYLSYAIHAVEDMLGNNGKNTISWLKSLRPQNNITDEELIKARNEAYNDALDKLEYHSDTPTFNDGWSAAIWYLKKRNDTNLKEEK